MSELLQRKAMKQCSVVRYKSGFQVIHTPVLHIAMEWTWWTSSNQNSGYDVCMHIQLQAPSVHLISPLLYTQPICSNENMLARMRAHWSSCGH